MVMLSVLKHVVFPGKTPAATIIGASEGLALLNIPMCGAMSFQVCSEVESFGAVRKIATITATMLAIDMIASDKSVVAFGKRNEDPLQITLTKKGRLTGFALGKPVARRASCLGDLCRARRW
jgi:hypothetical protein